jgi:hypothetical protein
MPFVWWCESGCMVENFSSTNDVVAVHFEMVWERD